MAQVKVWTEREAGDWEACVITSYLMGMVYGGFTAFPLGIYTQPEREALEPVKDEPMNFGLADTATQARYGRRLRVLSTGTLAHAVTRVGVGLVLSGVGFPDTQWSPGFTGYHAVFYQPLGAGSGLLFDPMAPDRSPGVLISSDKILRWAKGAGPNDAREVKVDEFMPDTTTIVEAVRFLNADGQPEPRSVYFSPGKTYTAYTLDGHAKTYAPTRGSMAHADSLCAISQQPVHQPHSTGWLRITDGIFGERYTNQSQPGITVAPDPSMGNAEVLRLRALIEAHVTEMTKPELEFLDEALPN